jgi:RND family efflux transporter MFP subunit
LSDAQVRGLGIATQVATAGSNRTLTAPAEVTVAPDRIEVLAAPVSARVEAVTAAVGQTTPAGKTLVRLSSAQSLDYVRETQTAEAALTLARQNTERDRQLHASGLIPKSRVDASESALLQAQTRARQAVRQQQLAGVSGDQPVQSIATRSGGVVVEVLAAPGARVMAGDPLLRLARVDALWLDIRVPAAQVAGVAAGSAVSIGGRESRATVTEVGRAVIPGTQSLPVRARVTDGATALRLGELVEARITLANGSDTMSIPSRAVWREAGATRVFVRSSPGHFRTADVQVVHDDGASAAVRGLQAGDAVVVQGIASLKSLRRGA